MHNQPTLQECWLGINPEKDFFLNQFFYNLWAIFSSLGDTGKKETLGKIKLLLYKCL